MTVTAETVRRLLAIVALILAVVAIITRDPYLELAVVVLAVAILL
jgi:hypothetical protein